MEKVISVETMRSSDSAEIARLGSGLGLMFNAGKAVFESVRWHGRVAVVCGSGNNGGDGYVIAMLLNESGVDCEIFRTSEKLSEDGAYYYNKCVEAGIKSVLMDAESDLRRDHGADEGQSESWSSDHPDASGRLFTGAS